MNDTVAPLDGEILPKETPAREVNADGLTVHEFKLSDLKVDDNYTRPSVVVLNAGDTGAEMMQALSGMAGLAGLASVVLMQEKILMEEGIPGQVDGLLDPAYDIMASPGRDAFDDIFGRDFYAPRLNREFIHKREYTPIDEVGFFPLPGRSRAPSRALENGNVRRRLAKYDHRSPQEKQLAAQVEARAAAKETKKLNARRQKNAARARSKKGR